MKINDLTAICGPSCANCPAYIATQKGGRTALEKVAAEWSASMGKTITAEDVTCDGCRVAGGRLSSYCGTCEIRLCAMKKKHETCAHCPDCLCPKIVAPPAKEALVALRKTLGL